MSKDQDVFLRGEGAPVLVMALLGLPMVPVSLHPSHLKIHMLLAQSAALFSMEDHPGVGSSCSACGQFAG